MKRAKLLLFGVACMLTVAASGTAVGQTTFCTKEQCSVARAACREWCPHPCVMEFRCVAPYCDGCISCTC